MVGCDRSNTSHSGREHFDSRHNGKEMKMSSQGRKEDDYGYRCGGIARDSCGFGEGE
jgi:hypothetical protein